MAASRSISTGASTSRERQHGRHYGYTHREPFRMNTRAPAFCCLFWVVSGLMYTSGRGHTQNEHFNRPHRLCQGLDRGPEPRCPDRGTPSFASPAPSSFRGLRLTCLRRSTAASRPSSTQRLRTRSTVEAPTPGTDAISTSVRPPSSRSSSASSRMCACFRRYAAAFPFTIPDNSARSSVLSRTQYCFLPFLQESQSFPVGPALPLTTDRLLRLGERASTRPTCPVTTSKTEQRSSLRVRYAKPPVARGARADPQSFVAVRRA